MTTFNKKIMPNIKMMKASMIFVPDMMTVMPTAMKTIMMTSSSDAEPMPMATCDMEMDFGLMATPEIDM